MHRILLPAEVEALGDIMTAENITHQFSFADRGWHIRVLDRHPLPILAWGGKAGWRARIHDPSEILGEFETLISLGVHSCRHAIWSKADPPGLLALFRGGSSADWASTWTVLQESQGKLTLQEESDPAMAQLVTATVAEELADECDEASTEGYLAAEILRYRAAEARLWAQSVVLGDVMRAARHEGRLCRGDIEVASVAELIGLSRQSAYKVLDGEKWVR